MSLNNEERPHGAGNILTLPCPGQSINRDDRQFKTYQLKIKPPPKVAELRNHLAALGLTKSGKQAELVERLRRFSENPDQWNSILFPARGRQRGDISQQTAKKSRTAQRIIETFGAREAELTYQSKKSGAQTRPIAQMSAQRETANDAWATAVMRKRKAAQTAAASSTEPSTAETPGAVAEGTDIAEGQQRGDMDIRRLARHIGTVDRGLHNRLGAVQSQLSDLQTGLAIFSATQLRAQASASTSALPQASALAHVPMLDLGSHLALAPPLLLGVPASSVACDRGSNTGTATSISGVVSITGPSPSPSPGPHYQLSMPIPQGVTIPREAIPARNLVIINLDGDEFAFDRTQVPNPPKVSFANDLPRLFREWHASEILTVNGRGIPVKHWDLFYKKRIGIKQHAWDVVRVQWGNWKFLVTERETFSSEAMFWAKYSDSEGNRLNFQKILDILQGSRQTDDDRDAAAALWFFDGNLGQLGAHGYFDYKKSGNHYVCTKTQTIASKWRKLLRERKDVAELWELARAASPLSDFNV